MTTVAEVMVKLIADPSGLVSDIKKAGTTSGATFGSAFGLSAAAGFVAFQAATTVIMGAGDAIKGAVAAAADFQKQMDLLQTQAGASAAEVAQLSSAVLTLAPSVATGPEELAKGLYHIESAGIRSSQAMDILKVAAEGAKVGNADLESVTNSLVAAQMSGVKGVESMTGAMGTLNAIVGSGNMRMGDLTDAFGTGILSAAKTFGVSIQSVGAALADMTNQGIPAIDAATRITSAMRLMAAPTTKAKTELASIGITSTQLGDDMRGPGGITAAIEDLKQHLDASGLSATQQAALLAAAFGGKQSLGVLTLVGNVQALDKATAAVAAGAGSFGDAWAQTQETLDFKMAKLQTTLGDVGIKIGSALIGPIGDFADKLSIAITDTEKFADDLAKTKGVNDFGSALDDMAKQLDFLSHASNDAGLQTHAAIQSMMDQLPRVPLLADAIDILTGSMTTVKNSVADMAQPTNDQAGAMGNLTASVRDTDGALQGLDGGLSGAATSIRDTDGALGGLDTGMGDVILTATKIPPTLHTMATSIYESLAAANDSANETAIAFDKANMSIDKTKAVVALLPADLAKSMEAGQTDWQAAVKAYGDVIKTDLTAAVETAQLQGVLTGKALAAGLNSTDPERQAAALALQKTVEDRLFALQYHVPQIALKTGEDYATALATKEQSVRDAAAKLGHPIGPDGVLPTPAQLTAWGYGTGTAYSQGLANSAPAAGTAATAVANAVRNIMKAASPPGPASPLHEIDLWGQKTGMAWVDAFIAALKTAPASVAGAMSDVAAAIKGYGGIGSLMQAQTPDDQSTELRGYIASLEAQLAKTYDPATRLGIEQKIADYQTRLNSLVGQAATANQTAIDTLQGYMTKLDAALLTETDPAKYEAMLTELIGYKQRIDALMAQTAATVSAGPAAPPPAGYVPVSGKAADPMAPAPPTGTFQRGPDWYSQFGANPVNAPASPQYAALSPSPGAAGPSVNIGTINNPVAEPASMSVKRQLNRLAAFGVLSG